MSLNQFQVLRSQQTPFPAPGHTLAGVGNSYNISLAATTASSLVIPTFNEPPSKVLIVVPVGGAILFSPFNAQVAPTSTWTEVNGELVTEPTIFFIPPTATELYFFNTGSTTEVIQLGFYLS